MGLRHHKKARNLRKEGSKKIFFLFLDPPWIGKVKLWKQYVFFWPGCAGSWSSPHLKPLDQSPDKCSSKTGQEALAADFPGAQVSMQISSLDLRSMPLYQNGKGHFCKTLKFEIPQSCCQWQFLWRVKHWFNMAQLLLFTRKCISQYHTWRC